MIEAIDQLDRSLFIFLNGFHSPFWDTVMVGVSSKELWLPVYLLILFFVYRKVGWKSTLLVFGCVALLITLSDQAASGLLKPLVGRLRPCQSGTGLDAYIVNGYCGGKFGFASSHAANFFAWATFISLFFRNKVVTILCFFAAAITAYSRIYLGVHYPGDVIVGGLIGGLLGLVMIRVYYKLDQWLLPRSVEN